MVGIIKPANYVKDNKTIQTAFVSTNSITQGIQPSLLWKNIIHEGYKINFAYKTFRWDSEANAKAHVHCVIIGFGYKKNNDENGKKKKNVKLYDESGEIKYCKNISPYLIDASNCIVESRTSPICKVPSIGIGNKPIDNGSYLFTEEEKNDFIKLEPKSKSYFKPWYGAKEFINNKKRFCLWLGECSPSELTTYASLFKTS